MFPLYGDSDHGVNDTTRRVAEKATDRMLVEALAYARAGLAVFPCVGKDPVIPKKEGGNGFHDATTDIDKIRGFWRKYPKANIGIRAGETSGFWVLDVDGDEAEKALAELETKYGPLPETVTCITGGGRSCRHLYFRYPGKKVFSRQSDIAKGLDSRGDGGYVIAAPSIHPDTGKRYEWQDGLLPDASAFAEAPEWLIDLVTGPNENQRKRKAAPNSQPQGKVSTANGTERYYQVALAGECKAVAEQDKGKRNGRLNTAAFKLGGFVAGEHLQRGIVERLLLAAATTCGLVADDGEGRALATIKSGLDAGIAAGPKHAPEPTMKAKAEKGKKGKTKANPRTQAEQEAPAAEKSGDWYNDAIVGAEGQVLGNLANVLLGLREDPAWDGVLTYDEMQATGLLMKPIPRFAKAMSGGTYPRPLRDDDILQIQEWFQISGLPTIGKDTTHDAVDLRTRECSFHPVRDYLTSLEWDGVPRLAGCGDGFDCDPIKPWLTTYFGVEDTPYSREIGKLFMISTVARIMRPGCKCDYMLILEGSQNLGKSTAIRILGDQWFSDGLPEDVATKDASQHLRGKWILEVAEMHAMGKSETAALKAFITRQEEKYRPSYGRKEVVEPRQCVFIGTTNKAQYLKDETGGRRFWPVKVATLHPIDTDKLTQDRDQLFAEAMHLFNNGENWWPSREFEQEYIVKEQEARFDADVWEDAIDPYLDEKMEEDIREAKVTVLELAQRALGMEVPKIGTADQRRITSILERFGWERGNRDGKGRWWVPGPEAIRKHLLNQEN